MFCAMHGGGDGSFSIMPSLSRLYKQTLHPYSSCSDEEQSRVLKQGREYLQQREEAELVHRKQHGAYAHDLWANLFPAYHIGPQKHIAEQITDGITKRLTRDRFKWVRKGLGIE